MATAALVQKSHVPVAGPADPLALAVKPTGLERQDLIANLLVVRLEVGDERKVARFVPRLAGEVRVDRARAGFAGIGKPFDVALKALAPSRRVGRSDRRLPLRRFPRDGDRGAGRRG